MRLSPKRGPERNSQSAACGLLDRVPGERVVVSLDGGRVRVRRKNGPRLEKEAQPIPYRLEGTDFRRQSLGIEQVTSSATTVATCSDVGRR